MSTQYAIPTNIDIFYMTSLCGLKFGRCPQWDGVSTFITFNPDLTASEFILFNAIIEVVNSKNNFSGLPDWATFTAQEASDFILNNILSGQTQAQLDASINTNISNITTASVAQINTRLTAIRASLSLIASGIISIRTVLQALAKAVVYLRNLALK